MKPRWQPHVGLWVQLVFAVAIAIAVAIGSVAYLAHNAASRVYAEKIDSTVQDGLLPQIRRELDAVAPFCQPCLGGIAESIATQINGRIVLVGTNGARVVDTNPQEGWPPPTVDLSFPFSLRGSELKGYLVIADPVGQILKPFDAALAKALLLPSAAGFLVGLAIMLIFSRNIARPLSNLTAAARRVGAGELGLRVPTDGPREIAGLAQEFNGMAARLSESQQQRQDMVADIAHELRTPLTVLRGYLEAMRDGVAPTDDATLGIVYDETLQLQALVSDLQDLAQAEAHELGLITDTLSVADLLRSAAAEFRVQAQTKNVELATELPLETPPVSGDARRLAQVLHNFLANALRYTPAGGRITLRAVIDRAGLRVEVQDTGPGIAAEHLVHIFDRFYRVDKSRARDTGGSGLGLTIARRLIEAHGGTIGVVSTPGQGSTFWFQLPYLSPEQLPTDPPVA